MRSGSGGEVQEADVYLPIVSQRYTIDLSRTRSHFLPGYPLDVVVGVKFTNPQETAHELASSSEIICTRFLQALLRLPDGSAAAGVPVDIQVSTSEIPWQGRTDQQGAVSTVFNIHGVNSITVEVSIELKKKELLIPL